MQGHPRSHKVNCHVHNSMVIMVVFLSFTFSRTLLCLGIIRPFSFLFSLLSLASSQVQQKETKYSCVPQIPDDKIPKVACHRIGVACWSYKGKREYSARCTYRSEYKKHDVAGKCNILTNSGADSSSRLGATPC